MAAEPPQLPLAGHGGHGPLQLAALHPEEGAQVLPGDRASNQGSHEDFTIMEGLLLVENSYYPFFI